MIELQAAVDTMMTMIVSGGAEAAKELFTGMALSGAKEVSRAWHDLFAEAPDAYPLADRVARDPTDPDLEADLRALLERVLREHPELRPSVGQAVQTGDIRAEHGSVAAAVIQGSTLTIDNSK